MRKNALSLENGGRIDISVMKSKGTVPSHDRAIPRVVGSARSGQLYKSLQPVALRMRREPTKSEQILWGELRGKKLGVKFRRQHLIDRFIVDYYCVKLGLVIEVDGGIHKQKLYADNERA